jgi:hypothetical protein
MPTLVLGRTLDGSVRWAAAARACSTSYKTSCPVLHSPAQPPRLLTALPSALVVVTFCIIGAIALSPGDAPESRRPAAGLARGVGSGDRPGTGTQGLSRGQPVSMGDNVSGEGRAAHAGSAWQRYTKIRPGTRGVGAVVGGVRGCSHVPRNGQAAQRRAGTRGQRASAGGPRRAYVLPVPEVVHQRVCRHRLARGVHYLSVARREERAKTLLNSSIPQAAS